MLFYLLESERTIEPKDIECAKNIKDNLKVHKLELYVLYLIDMY